MGRGGDYGEGVGVGGRGEDAWEGGVTMGRGSDHGEVGKITEFRGGLQGRLLSEL